MKTVTNPSRRGAERGASFVETTTTLLVLFGLLFLLIDLSLALFAKAALQEAVRAGVRFAVTERLGTGQSYLNDSIVQVVQQSSLGMLNGANGACKVSINYYNPITGQASTGTGGDVIEVSVSGYNYTPIGILKSSSPITITASSSDVMEPCPLGGCPAIVNPTPPTCP